MKVKEKQKVKKIVSRFNSDEVLFTYTGDLRNADLRGTDLKWTNLTGADLTSAILTGANLRDADLRNAILTSANLKNAKTCYCIVNFNKSEIEQAKQFVKGLEL